MTLPSQIPRKSSASRQRRKAPSSRPRHWPWISGTWIAPAGVLLLAPGMLLVAVAESRLALGLDRGRMWGAAIVIGLALFLAFLFVSKRRDAENPLLAALFAYLALSLLVLATLCVCHFAFGASFPGHFLHEFFGDPVPAWADPAAPFDR